MYCGRCHGCAGAENFGILPDLRYTALLGSSDAWAMLSARTPSRKRTPRAAQIDAGN